MELYGFGESPEVLLGWAIVLVRRFASTSLPAGAPAAFTRYDAHSFNLRVINTADTAPLKQSTNKTS